MERNYKMMSKKFMVINSDEPGKAPKSVLQSRENYIDWDKCCLCQQTTADPLRCPTETKRKDIKIGSGYKSLAEQLQEFNKLDGLSENVNFLKLAEGHGIERNFKIHNAKYHKKCRDQFNSTKLQRMQKRRHSNDIELENTPQKVTRLNNSESPKSTDKTTSNICFFCDESTGTLHKVETFHLDQRIRQAALLMQDTWTLGKLSSGDMIAQDAMYHLHCLTAFYRKVDKANTSTSTDRREKRLQGIALAELVSFIEEVRGNSCDSAPVFKLSDLASMYASRLDQLGCNITSRLHTTDLKKRILEQFPCLQAHKHGREVLLVFKDDIGDALKIACGNNYDEEAIHLSKAANIVRRDIMEHEKYAFKGEFEEQCQENSVPQSLLTLVSMILGGPNIKDQTSNMVTQASLTIAQLLFYNLSVRRRAGSIAVFHSKEREPPLPVYIGLKLHAETRKRGLIDRLFRMGMSVSYDRVLELSTDIGNAVCARFEAEELVCPPKLRKELFTTGAVDNIDHNPSSTTAHGSLHGTGISLFQHPSPHFDGHKREVVVISETQVRKTIRPLPDVYTSVPPIVLRETEPQIPETQGFVTPTGDTMPGAMQGQYSWLNHVKDVILDADDSDSEQDMYISWAAFRADACQLSSYSRQNSDISSLLPLFDESSKSPAMIKHAKPRTNSCHCFRPASVYPGKENAMDLSSYTRRGQMCGHVWRTSY